MLNATRIFLKVVEQGSFSRAASVLTMAPSSVARAIDGLEQELAATLFERSTRQLKLTHAGQQFYRQAQPWVEQADELRLSVRAEHSAVAGRLKISVFEAFGQQQLASKIPLFLQQHPNIQIDIEHENRLLNLFEDDVDVAIRIGRPADSGLKAITLMSNDTHIVAAPDYWQRHGLPDSPDALSAHNCLLLNRGRQLSYWHFRRGSEHQRIAVSGNLSSRGGMPLLTAALAGLGVVQLSQWATAEAVANGALQPCLSDWHSSLQAGSSGQVYAVYRASTYPNPLVRAFIDFLKQMF
ncbi:transcriptional regulator [Bacterioplanes sanyensis]|uniref:Transcriptional regulator n=1 Tax=Bacterioplanes sanyensis TaxID=1249553 RepID=A0A222FKD3_9GAMM|nr:LysR family transcriptional regulator [Bacterioplanes sanyensis]ASP39240.1 transcriptional regulator [Bacterioplanes sanyensis]